MSAAIEVKSKGTGAKVCVPVCARTVRKLRDEINRANAVADLIELRLDCLNAGELDKAVRSLNDLLVSCQRRVVLTVRSATEGGQCSLSNLERHHFWLKHLAPNKHNAAFIDIELGLALLFLEWERAGTLSLDWSQVICSHHDFAGVPVDLEKIYERMARTPARVLKIAVSARETTDAIPLFKLLERAQREGRELIPVAMGQPGVVTRILGPSRGAFLTFGSLDVTSSTAPGQVTVAELSNLYRINTIDEQTEIMGVIGSTLTHSISPHMHNAAFAALGINAVYLPFEINDLPQFVQRMARPKTREINWRLRGFSITTPHKVAILDELDWIEDSAREIGAVNTVVIEDQLLLGYNTDAVAALAPLRNVMELRGVRIALIGAGGAARALLWSLHQEEAQVTVFSRRPDDVTVIAESFGAKAEQLVDASFDGFDLIINATPLGTRGPLVNQTPATADQLGGVHLAYDLVYNPVDTRFLREARMAGCDTIGGLEMLVAQAADQFRLWTGQQAPLVVMREAAGTALAEMIGGVESK
jgi:3-dehydroquinate dehydratase/shikimate dehydrogenase